MKLYEEINLWETLWEDATSDQEQPREFKSEYARLMSTPEGRAHFWELPVSERSALIKADREADPVQKVLDEIKEVDLEYGGFSHDWFEDHFDPNSQYGHYQTGGTNYYNSFTYTVDATSVFECLDGLLPFKLDKLPVNDLTTEYKRLLKVYNEAPDDKEDEANEALALFLAQNLIEFVEIAEEYVLDYFAEEAEDWAVEHADYD